MALKDSPDVVYWRSRPKSALTAALTACLTVLLVLSTAAAPQARAKDSALFLKQWSQLLGATDLLVSKQGIRLRISSRNMTLLMTQPAWKVQFLNMKRKIYCQIPAIEWRSPMTATASFFRPGDPSSLRVVRSEPSSLNDLTCRKYTLRTQVASNYNANNTWERLLVKGGILYAIEDKYFPRDVTIVLGKTYGTLQVSAIPLAFTCVNNENSVCEEIKLTSHSDVPLNATDLQVPKDFKQVKTIAEVSESEKDAQGFSEFIK